MSADRAALTADLLRRYDRPGPRYTSYPTAVEFHAGFRAVAADLDPGYRGQDHVALACVLAEPAGGVLTPAVLGEAARSGRHDPQAVKRVWHCLARFGRRRP